MKAKALRIDWIDCTSWGDCWRSYESLSSLKLDPIITRGEVVKQTRHEIFLAQSVSHDQCHNIVGIPRGCILKKQEIP